MTSPAVGFPPVQSSKSRLLITLVVDTSSSMARDDAIGQLNEALRSWRESVHADNHLRHISEIAVVTFGAGGVRVVDPTGHERGGEPFAPITRFQPPTLRAGGFSPMVAGIKQGLQVMDQRRQALAREGIQMAYTPLVFLLTDGAPSDERGKPCELWRNLAPELRRQEQEQGLMFFAFGVRGADAKVLQALAPDKNYQADGTDFASVLGAVRQSIDRVVRSTEGVRTEEMTARLKKRKSAMDWITDHARGDA
ncbi:vWA domain-containing protein [Paractinoplanes atraurantiacus]|uniref:Uncharacterized conserved protein YegL, contains vWA domain of TerY type n=1 Tax=Paractinoplanes atraurantiacus TaxID=1036182 RepID=A0A285KC33_9ACTN|nr:VWA domain-containing protein [Actinoplanes atraurantiacus]SNY69517.1 Uncharacterized conserved protein YegL, contains vWA domain of TerY type [Actinoplanes atraurantiacus]